MQTGLRIPGNIDLNARPVVRNPDGSISTVRSMSFGTDQGEVLIPTVIGDRVVSDEEAIRHYQQTGEQLGVFDTPENATAYAQTLHQQQEKQYMPQAQSQQQSPGVADALAARGLRTYTNHLRYRPLTPSQDADPMANAIAGGEASTAPVAGSANGGSGSGGVTAAAPTVNTALGDSAADPALIQQFEQAAAQSPDGDPDSMILPLLAVGALGVGALAAYRKWKANRPAPTAPIPVDGSGGGALVAAPAASAPNPQQGLLNQLPEDGIIDGEFTEVNEPRLPPPEQVQPKPATVAEALTARPGAQRRMSSEQARTTQQRAAQGQPNDQAPIRMNDEFPYPEEQIRQANAIADELIAQRLRGQRQVRAGRSRAGAPSAPINPRAPTAGNAEARPALVNEILGILRRGIVR